MDGTSTRDEVWADICARHQTRAERMAAWVLAPVIRLTPDAEWAAMHAGTCGLCEAPGRLYACGWRCEGCAP